MLVGLLLRRSFNYPYYSHDLIGSPPVHAIDPQCMVSHSTPLVRIFLISKFGLPALILQRLTIVSLLKLNLFFELFITFFSIKMIINNLNIGIFMGSNVFRS